MKIQLSSHFAYLLNPKERKRFNIFYGGRGGGKTKSLMLFCMIEFLKFGKNILVLREFNINNKDSVYAEFLSFIYEYDLKDLQIINIKAKSLLDCNKTEIINNNNNSRITFYALNDYNLMNLKSYSGYDIAWVEESHYITKKAIDILNPTLRKKDSYLLFSFNPQNNNDYIYQLALSKNEYVKATKINYDNNPFYNQSGLEASRLLMLENVKLGLDTLDNYRHHWEGEPVALDSDCVFNNEVFNKCLLYEYDVSLKSYNKLILSIDPATTAKEYSNETGLILAGLTNDNIIHIISDYSECLKPNELADVVNNLWVSLNLDCVVIETNNGGDFIASVLLNKNPLIIIKEVRAFKDKQGRAGPVSVLMNLKKVLIYKEASVKLFKQMKLLTNKGYKGLKGESPDALDAMVWAVYYLFDLNDKNTKDTIFKTSLLNADIKGYILNKHCNMGIIGSECFVILKFNIILDNQNKKIDFIDCIIKNTIELKEFLVNNDKQIYFQNNKIASDLNLLTYDKSDLLLKDYVIQTLPKLKNINVYNVKNRYYDNYEGNLLIRALDNYTLDKQDLIIECFCDVINNNLTF